MPLTKVESEKAYKYAYLMALNSRLSKTTIVDIDITDEYRAARSCFVQASMEGKTPALTKAADAAAKVFVTANPGLLRGSNVLTLTIRSAARDATGDVRDVVCIRISRGGSDEAGDQVPARSRLPERSIKEEERTMTREEHNAIRLAYALYSHADEQTVAELARLLNYYEPQLQIDIEALYHTVDKATSSRQPDADPQD